jgi:hypothetical protein
MAEETKKFLLQIKKYIADRTLITNLIANLTITFGVVLIVSGLYFMIFNPSASTQVSQANTSFQSAVSAVNWVPGVPFYFGDLSNVAAVVVGSISWIMGVDLLLVGLGLWARNRLARFAAIMIFVLAAFFQFVQFLYLGVMGSPASIVELFVDGSIAYFLFSRFDPGKIPAKQQAILSWGKRKF